MLSHWEERRLRSGLTALHSLLRRGSTQGGTAPCSMVPDNGMHRNGTKLFQGRVRLDMKKKFFTMRVGRLPCNMVEAPSRGVQEAFR